MTASLPDSFDVAAIGRQSDSKKETMPAYSFGTSARDRHAAKVFISAKHELRKCHMNSPGPIYGIPSTVGDAPKYGFGSSTRKHPKAKYPDTSVDLTGAEVDTQKVKYESTKLVHFGTESRSVVKNAEVIRTNPSVQIGMESPGCMEYSPEHLLTTKHEPEYSFGAKGGKSMTDGKPLGRLSAPPISTPRHVGPGSHVQPSAMGTQPKSEKSSAPNYSIGSARRHTPRGDIALLDISPELSSLGKQVISSARSAPRHSFGTGTRDQQSRRHMVMTKADQGPVANMPKPNFNVSLPPPCKALPRPGI